MVKGPNSSCQLSLQQHTLVKELLENSIYSSVTVSKVDETLLKVEGETLCFNLTYLNLSEGKDLGFYKTS